MSPVLSWVIFGVCVGIGALVYAALVAGGRADDRYERMWHAATDPVDRFPPVVRLYGGIYDHEARGDFDHDPIRDHEWCDGCAALLRRALNRIGDRHGGPRSADDLVAAIREELES
jgi:hypothetical protein